MSKRALHIPAAVLELDLPLLACAVLAEVIDLYKVSGQVFASDEHFAERCKANARTIRRTITELESAGYITRTVDYSARHKRRLVPGEKWRNQPEVVDDLSTTKLAVVDKLAGSSGQNAQESRTNQPEVVDDLSNINTIINTKETFNQTPTPSAPEKKIGAGEFLEDSTSSLKAEVQIVPPVAEPPHAGQSGPLAAAELPAALKAEVKDLATEMGKMWGLSEQQGFPGWSRLYAFAKHQAQQGQLPELRAQLAGYKAGHMRPGVRAHKLGDWLGDPQYEVGPYRNGIWCSCTWADIAAQVQARPTGATQSAPTPTRAGGSPSQAAAYRPR